MFIKSFSSRLLILLMAISTAAAAAPADKTDGKTASTAAVTVQQPAIPVHKNALPPHPASKNILHQPQTQDFDWYLNAAGGYALALPKAFGSDPLSALPQAAGPMLVRAADNNLLLSVNIIDPQDTQHYQATQALPDFPDKKLLWKWPHSAWLEWNCSLSEHQDYYGQKLLLQAQSVHNGKTYELLYIFPAGQYATYLPQALYSLNSFRLDFSQP